MTHIETPLNAPMRHLVIGHSQVRHVWQHVPENANNSDNGNGNGNGNGVL